MDDALKQVEKVLLAAVPAYEMYFLQAMGKAYHLKPPLLHVNSEKLKITFDSNDSGDGVRDRLVMYVEFNRAMGSCTVTTEYWDNIKSTEPAARGEAKVDATSENLMAPAFAFGWLHKVVGSSGESVEEGMDPVEARMVQAERLIVKADEVLEELGFVIEADSYESYANTLDSFLLSERLEEQTEGVLRKVGNVVRGAAKAFGHARGGYQGLKQRWSDFKASVKGAYGAAHKKSFDKWSGKGEKPASAKPGAKPAAHEPAKAAEPAAPAKGKKGKLKLVRGGKKGGDRYPGGKMKDTEYKARYGKMRMASSLDEPDLDTLVDDLRDQYFEQEFLGLDVNELLALEALMLMMQDGAEPLDEAGGKFQKLVGKLKARGGVKNPAALAAWIGRKKYGHEKFQKMASEGRKRRTETTHPSPAVDTAVSSYQKLSGLVLPMQGWSLYKGK